jgi:uncharacterized membrane protein YdjX (TVP38/TMEM64 family)
MDDNKRGGEFNFWGFGAAVLVLVILAWFIDLSSLKTWIEGRGVWGPVIFILLKISTIVVAPLSGSPLYPLVGLLFGFWPGILYVLIGDILGYTIAFYISRIFGQKIVLKLLSQSEENILGRIINHVSDTKGFFHACLTLFALPEVLSYGAGLSRLSYIKFISILMPLSATAAGILVFFGSILKPQAGSLWIGILIPVVGMIAVLIGGTLFVQAVRKREDSNLR